MTENICWYCYHFAMLIDVVSQWSTRYTNVWRAAWATFKWQPFSTQWTQLDNCIDCISVSIFSSLLAHVRMNCCASWVQVISAISSHRLHLVTNTMVRLLMNFCLASPMNMEHAPYDLLCMRVIEQALIYNWHVMSKIHLKY